jgi:hypothetical protein
VSPNVIDTPTHSDDTPAAPSALHPQGQFGVIDEVFGPVLCLEAASHVTGEIQHIGGGRSTDR